MVGYDKYYEVEDLFGNPYPELIDYMNKQERSKLLDLGCGQGRDAIPLARMGFNVKGVDNSKVGIDQMEKVATKESLSLRGEVADIFLFNDLESYSFILLDSMFHFAKRDKQKEVNFIARIVEGMSTEAQIIVCIQDTGKKVKILRDMLEGANATSIYEDQFVYLFEDKESGHSSKTDYQMIVATKN